MFFTSDNWAGAHPAIAAGLTSHAGGFAGAYGKGDLDRAVEDEFSAIFGREVAVFVVGTGTAANALAMAAVNRPGGVIFCHPEAHMMEDECGAPEYFTGGARLCGVGGRLGRMDPDALDAAIRRYPAEFIHNGQPMAVSITQATEIGTLYTPEQIRAISAVCRRHGLPLHMDGARFANALVGLGVSPAAMTSECGVDILSFGATKNGCWCAEAVVFLDRDLARDMAFLRKRAGQLFSKGRFVSAQFSAYFRDGLWLETARGANAMAVRLADGLAAVPGVRLAWRPEANEVFAVMGSALMHDLHSKGARFHEWPVPGDHRGEVGRGEVLCRLVTSFATTEADVDRFVELALDLSGTP
jgi:threonine aldolase